MLFSVYEASDKREKGFLYEQGKRVQFDNTFRYCTRSDDQFLALWHFGTSKTKNCLKSNCRWKSMPYKAPFLTPVSTKHLWHMLIRKDKHIFRSKTTQEDGQRNIGDLPTQRVVWANATCCVEKHSTPCCPGQLITSTFSVRIFY